MKNVLLQIEKYQKLQNSHLIGGISGTQGSTASTSEHACIPFSRRHHSSAPCRSSTPTIPFQPASIIKPHHLSPSIDVNHPSLPGKVLFSELNSKGWKAKAGNPNVCARVKTTVPVSPEPCLEG